MKARACSYSCRGVRVDVEEVVVDPVDSGDDDSEEFGAPDSEDSGTVVSEDPAEVIDPAEESTVEPADLGAVVSEDSGKSASEEDDSFSAWICGCPASVGLSELLQAANAKTAKAIVR